MTTTSTTTTPEIKHILCTSAEACEMLHIGETKLRELTRRGFIPAVRFGRCVRYRLADLEDFCARSAASALENRW